MVFPSRGCQTCKKRRVKCDTAKPVCERCQKAKKTCIWDPNDQEGLHFKSENVFARGQPRRPRRPKEIAQEIMTRAAPAPSKSPPGAMALDMLALNYWIENFMFRFDDLPEMGHEYTNYVIFHWIRAKPGSSLHLALSALSQAVFGRAKNIAKVESDADKTYAQAIVRTNEEMNELSGESIQQLMLTIMLMGFYENVMYDSTSRERPGLTRADISRGDGVGGQFWKTFCHHEGAMGLLKLSRKGAGRNIPLDKVIRRQVIRTCILRGVAVPRWLHDGAEYGEQGPTLDLDALLIRVAAVRAKSLSIASDVRDIVSEVELLDAELTRWSSELPSDWNFSTYPSSITQSSSDFDLLYTGPIHNYTTHSHAAVWSRFRAARLIVNSLLNRALSSLPGSSVILQQQYRENIITLANDMCGCIPFFFTSPNLPEYGLGLKSIRLGKYVFNTDLDIIPKFAGLIVWPLAVAVSTEGVPEPQRKWLKRKLSTAALSIGDTVLQSIVDNEEFKF